jgi:hypothetical protein
MLITQFHNHFINHSKKELMTQHFPLKYEGDLNGILSANPSFFTYEASPYLSDSIHNLSFLFESGVNRWYCSTNEEWSYFIINFQTNVIITNYTVKVGNWGSNEAYPKQFCLSVFYQSQWKNISSVIKSQLNGPLLNQTFSTDFFVPTKSIKLTMIGLNYHTTPYYYFCLSNIEVFGYINVTKFPFCSQCPSKKNIFYSGFCELCPIF